MVPGNAARQILALFSALLLISVMGCGAARASTPKHHPSHKHAAAHKKTGKHKAVTVTASRHAPQPSLAIITKPPTDAPDFDYRDRIAEAQALAQNAPVLPGDMEVVGGQLAHFTWVLVVGQKTGPLTVLRMDESGHNDQGFTITWPVDNFLNTKFHVASPDGIHRLCPAPAGARPAHRAMAAIRKPSIPPTRPSSTPGRCATPAWTICTTCSGWPMTISRTMTCAPASRPTARWPTRSPPTWCCG